MWKGEASVPASAPLSASGESRTPCADPAPLKAHPALTFILGALPVNGAVALWLWALGRNALPTAGPLQRWSLSTRPEDNSQHLAGLYSLVHFVSGTGLHVILQKTCFFRPLWQRLLMAIASSGMWEVVENTSWVIALFKGAPGAGNHRGDSIVNALSDTAFVTLGFLAARFAPLWAIAAFAAFVGGLFFLIPMQVLRPQSAWLSRPLYPLYLGWTPSAGFSFIRATGSPRTQMGLRRASSAVVRRSSPGSTAATAAPGPLVRSRQSVRQDVIFFQSVVADWDDVGFYRCRLILRTKGARNARFEERRSELLDRLKARLTQRGAMRPTLRELAAAAGCSVSTLAHYFGRRDDIVRAVFADARRRSEVQLAPTRRPASNFEESIREVAALSWRTLTRHGVAGSLAMGMVEGMRNDLLGPCFIDTMFEPFIIALTERLDAHVARGEMRSVDTRIAALALASPLLLGALHQDELGGARLYPLDGEAFLTHVVDGFIRAYRAG